MPDLQNAVRWAWGDATGGSNGQIQAAVRFAWGDGGGSPPSGTAGGFIQSIGSAYTRPVTPPAPPIPPTGLLTARTIIPAQSTYDYTYELTGRDLRTGTVFDVLQASMDLSEGSILWTLSGSAPGESDLYSVLTTGEQPPTVAIILNSVEWHFVLDRVSLGRDFGNTVVNFSGRSLAGLSDGPRQASRHWIADAPTTAAQVATLAQTFTGLNVVWLAPDWIIPAQAWSYFGSPLDVVRQGVAAIGAVAEAARDDNAITVRSKYPIDPNMWGYAAPEWQIPWAFVDTSTSEVADSPEYNGVLVAGQQQGGIADVRLAGTAGDAQAPMVTDPMLTDLSGVIERATSILFSAGKKARVTRTMLVPSEGPVGREHLVRWVDPTETWVGMVRGVSVSAGFGTATQTVLIERRTSFQAGTFVPAPEPAPIVPTVVQGVIQVSPGLALNIPSHQAGDLLVLFLRAASGDTPPATPSGWTSHITSLPGPHRGWRIVSKIDADNSISSINAADQMWMVICRNAAVGAVQAGDFSTGVISILPDLLLQDPGSSVVLSGVVVTDSRVLGNPVDQQSLLSADFAGGSWAVWQSPPGQSNWFNYVSSWTGSTNAQPFALELKR